MNGLNSKKYDKLKKIKHDWDEAAKKKVRKEVKIVYKNHIRLKQEVFKMHII